jgi:hypothetical protein
MDEGGRKLEDFLFRHHAADIAAMDMFVVPTIGFKLWHRGHAAGTGDGWCGPTPPQTRPWNGSPCREKKRRTESLKKVPESLGALLAESPQNPSPIGRSERI